MSRDATLKRILDGGIIAVVRAESGDQLLKVVEALADGGVTAAEITFTVPDAIDVIRQVRRELADAVVLGAGTVLDPETARAALLAGAEYIVAPTVNLDVIRLCRRYDKVVMPGALTPTEVLAAWEAGADVVKIFPADLGGPPYLKALRAPLPQVRMMPTGGVDLQTAEPFLKAGACCLGVGGSLVDPKAVAAGDFAQIRERASRFAAIVREFRRAGPMRRTTEAIRLAFAFLTIFPVGTRDAPADEADLAASRYAYPLVGLAVGLLLAGLSLLFDRLGVSRNPAAFGLMAVGVIVTGGLHLDGLADTFDGLFLGGGRERRLAVLRDPHVGSFGATALILSLIGRFAALSVTDGRGRALALLGAAAVSRTLPLVSAGLSHYARPDGTGRVLIGAVSRRDAYGAAVAILIISAVLSGRDGLAAAVCALGLAWCLTRLAARRLGGVTGDILGAIVELGELSYLLALAFDQSV